MQNQTDRRKSRRVPVQCRFKEQEEAVRSLSHEQLKDLQQGSKLRAAWRRANARRTVSRMSSISTSTDDLVVFTIKRTRKPSFADQFSLAMCSSAGLLSRMRG